MFNKLGRLEMMWICEKLEMENFDRGAIINFSKKDNDSVFFLKKGTIKIESTKYNSTKYIVKKGNIFGELSLCDSAESSEEYAVALEESIVCYIESERMVELMRKHKSLKNGVLKIYGLRIKKLERRLNDLLYKDSQTRIKEFISEYLIEFGEENNEGILVAKNLLTHKEIANLTNTSRQTVNNVLSIMRKEGAIDYNSSFISKNRDEEKNSFSIN